MITIITFFIILGALVLVHEFGHFVVAKKAGVRVDEFGFGYPPRMLTIGRKWGTVFTLNWIPFGGFVKIFGENYVDEEYHDGTVSGKKFTQISKLSQASILFAGVFFNFLFACFLFIIAFMVGMPTTIDNDFGVNINNPKLTITSVIPNSPAYLAKLKVGDKIISVSDTRDLEDLTIKDVSDFIDSADQEVLIGINRGGEGSFVEVRPEYGIVANRKAIGIGMDFVGTVKLPVIKSFIEGTKLASRFTYMTVVGLFDLIVSIFRSDTDLSAVTGPVGIISLVGDASKLGVIYLLTFTALISINLAVINMIPFPALDGGRLLFVLIEFLKGGPINSKFASTANFVGFALLIILMIVVTIKDFINLF